MTRTYKPAPPHRSNMAPAVCMCVECCRKVADLRCTANAAAGERCGDYRGHRGGHTPLICSDFMCADERIRLDGGEADG